MGRFTGPGWLLRHAVVLVLVATFLGLGWWQLGRAEQGNALSFGYTLEWPVFAAFVIFMWIREMRMTLRADAANSAKDVDRAGQAGTPEPSTPAAQSPGVTSFDAQAALARRAEQQRAAAAVDEASDYNQYLAWLAAHPEARPRGYRRSGVASRESESTHG